MEVLVLDGKDYVKASKAARDLGYTTDYIGQLCRSGQVDAHLIGRTWYVNADKLSIHKVEKKRASRVKAKESAHKSIEAHRVKVQETRNNYNNVAIRYENDSEELIPEPRKLSVRSESVAEFVQQHEDEGIEENIIENKGKAVIMSGDVTVIDVTDTPDDPDTIVLKPGRIQKSEQRDYDTSTKKRNVSVSMADEINDVQENSTFEVQEEPRADDFITKLIHKEVIQESEAITDAQINPEQVRDQKVFNEILVDTAQNSLLPYIIMIVLLLAMTILSVPLKSTLEYQGGEVPTLTESFHFSIDEALYILQSKI
jgi:hypothetical protein